MTTLIRPGQRVLTIDSAVRVSRRAMAAPPAGNWWEVAGKTTNAAYQPKDAASLAVSYINLANPGTNDAAPGTAPTWNPTDGWIWNNTHVLLTGISAGAGMSMLVRFSGVPNASDYRPVIGNQLGAPRLYLWPSGEDTISYGAGEFSAVSPYLAAGVLAVAGQQGYRDGVADGPTISTASGTWGTIRIGIVDGWSLGFIGNIQAVAIYADTLSADEVATVSAAMAAL